MAIADGLGWNGIAADSACRVGTRPYGSTCQVRKDRFAPSAHHRGDHPALTPANGSTAPYSRPGSDLPRATTASSSRGRAHGVPRALGRAAQDRPAAPRASDTGRTALA